MLRDDDRDGFFFVLVSVQQCNLGDLRALRKGMTLYHSESQLSSLPKRQEAMLNVSTRRRTTDRPTVHTHTHAFSAPAWLTFRRSASLRLHAHT